MAVKKRNSAPAREIPNITPRMLTVPLAAQYLGATEWFVRTQCWNQSEGDPNGLPHVIFGKRIVIDQVELDRWIERQKKAA